MLKAIDGFDHYASAADLGQRSGNLQWTPQDGFLSGSPGVVTIESPGLTGTGKCVRVTGHFSIDDSAQITASLDASRATQIIGFRCLIDSTPTTVSMAVDFIDTIANAPQIRLLFNPTFGNVSVYRNPSSLSNGTLLGTSDNNLFAHDVANFFEIKATIGDSVGEVIVQNNGVAVYTLSNVDTKQTANASFGAVTFRPWDVPFVGYAGFSIDDFYYCDTTAGASSYPTDTFLGDVGIVTLFVVGNDSVAWSPLTGQNWQMVDEPAFGGDASYNSSATPGDEDRFNFETLPAAVLQAIAVQITGAYRKDDVGGRTLKQGLKSGSTESYGATRALPNDYAYFSDVYEADPDGSVDWTVAAVNALKGACNLVS